MNVKDNYYDVVIAGQGAAAFAAGLYAARYQIKSLIIGETFGGETATGGLIENYPGEWVCIEIFCISWQVPSTTPTAFPTVVPTQGPTVVPTTVPTEFPIGFMVSLRAHFPTMRC